MSYTHVIRACLASAYFPIPVAVQQHLDGLDRALEAGLDVILSSSNEGCSGELTVIDAVKLNEFADLSNAVRTDDIGQPAYVPEAKVELVLSVHDADNCVVDSAPAELTIKQVQYIVDVASSLVLAHRNGQDTDEYVEQLDLELCRADVLADQVSSESNGEAQEVEVVFVLDDDEPLSSLTYERSFLKQTGEDVLVDVKHLPSAAAILFETPDTTTQKEAEAYMRSLGLTPFGLDLSASENGSDAMVTTQVTVRLPIWAVHKGSLDEVAEFAALHWQKHFYSLTRDEQVDVVNRYVASMNGVDG